jgi:hypothetical protein
VRKQPRLFADALRDSDLALARDAHSFPQVILRLGKNRTRTVSQLQALLRAWPAAPADWVISPSNAFLSVLNYKNLIVVKTARYRGVYH